MQFHQPIVTVPYLLLVGAACALLLLAIAKLVIEYRHNQAGRWLLVFLLGAVCFLTRSLIPDTMPISQFVVEMFLFLTPGAFWLFAHSLCRESEPFPKMAWLLIILNWLFNLISFHTYDSSTELIAWLAYGLFIATQPIKLALIVMALVTLARHYKFDLVQARRRLRAALLLVLGTYLLLVIGFEVAFLFLPAPVGIDTLHAFFAFAIAFSVCAWILEIAPGAQPTSLAAATTGSLKADLSFDKDNASQKERVLLNELKQVMLAGVYRQTGLNIASLAEQIGCREYVLRNLINKRLGYRNFNDFLNRYRIDDVTRQLSEPSQPTVPILDMALAAGFGSMSPFNEAFKRCHGLTPTEFRLNLGNKTLPPLGT